MEEINQKTNIFVTYKLVTKKRKVTAIEFGIKDNRREQIAREKKKEKTSKISKCIDRLKDQKGKAVHIKSKIKILL